ncbi:MAG: phage major capsid protein, P2 family [Candidatus Reddybacter sp.]
MRTATRELYNGYLRQQAQLNGVLEDTVSSGKKFAATPSVSQTLEDRIQESSAFLQSINVVGVTEQEGETIGLGTGSTIAGTTDTDAQDRATTDPSDLNTFGYRCEQTNFDTHLKYAKLDMWAKFPDFQTRIRDAIIRQIARDRLMIGWNGTSRAATSNRATSPLLQDVNAGWLQYVRDNDAARIMTQGATANEVRVSDAAGADYKNVDSMVFDMVEQLLDQWHAEDTGLVAIMGRQLLADKYFPIIDDNNVPTEKIASDLIVSQKRVGGLPAVRVPFFPARTLAVTTYENLSVYWQEGTRRRTLFENAKRDRIEDYQSINEDYVVEDTGAFCAVENIKLWNGTAWV